MAMEGVAEIENIDREKWDWALPLSIKRKAFASTHLDVEGALSFARGAGASAES
jgi:ATP-dependent Lhr-like helicase